MKKVYFKSIHKMLTFTESIITIYFESPIIYRNLHYTLEEELLFSDEDNMLEFNSNVYVLYNLFQDLLIDKKIINALYKKLEKSINVEAKEKIESLKEQFISILKHISLDLDFPIQYNEDFSFSKLLTLFQVGFEELNENNYLEFLVSFFRIVSELLDINLFITFDLASYLIKEEYLLLKNELLMLNIYVLDLCYTPKYFQNECLLIDSDWCII